MQQYQVWVFACGGGNAAWFSDQVALPVDAIQAGLWLQPVLIVLGDGAGGWRGSLLEKFVRQRHVQQFESRERPIAHPARAGAGDNHRDADQVVRYVAALSCRQLLPQRTDRDPLADAVFELQLDDAILLVVRYRDCDLSDFPACGRTDLDRMECGDRDTELFIRFFIDVFWLRINLSAGHHESCRHSSLHSGVVQLLLSGEYAPDLGQEVG